jgi:hypothetical protein
MLRFLFAALFLLPFSPNPASGQSDGGFQFVRIRYGGEVQNEGFGRRRRRMAPWAHDYPTAEYNFYEAVRRTTRVRVAGDPLVLDLSDDRIFEHSFLYLCEPGYWEMGSEEAANLARFLDRGGFILFDDFRGENEWMWFEEMMREVVPDIQPVEIPPDHPIWTIFYDIDPISAPSLVSGGYGPSDDSYRAYFDKDGRMMAFACFNQDIGDGWEWPHRNLASASTISFQMGINFLIWALTH